MRKILFISSGSELGGGEKNIFDIAGYILKNKKYEVSAIVPSEGLLAEKFREIGCNVNVCSLSLLKLNKLRKIIKKEQPDLVHIQGLKASFAGRIVTRIMEIPCINGVHGLHYFYYKNFIKGKAYLIVDRFLRRWTDGFICASKSVYDRVVGPLKVDKSKVWLIYNGIDCDSIAMPDANIAQNRKPVICVGRLQRPKGQIYLLKAVPLINQNLNDVQYLFVGDGEDKDDLQSYIKDNGLGNCVSFTGFTSNVLDLMRNSSILVVPSLWECLPYVILEAMAVELPVVATNVGGIPEIVVDGETGILVPPEDENALSEAITKLLNDTELCAKMGKAGKERILKYFSKDKMCQKTLDVYSKILGYSKRLGK